jgi:hypothetical protein
MLPYCDCLSLQMSRTAQANSARQHQHPEPASLLSFTMGAPEEGRSRPAIRETMVRPLAAVGICQASIWYDTSWTKIRVIAQNDECCLWQDPQQRKGETVHVC